MRIILKSGITKIIFILSIILNFCFGQIKVACVGNSITWGEKLSNQGSESYPAQLAVLLGNGYTVKNFGGSGRTLLKNTSLPYIGSSQHTYSIATPHDIVIILLGTNDTYPNHWVAKEDFKNDYYELINDYKNYPGHEDPVFIIGLPPPLFTSAYEQRNETLVNEIIPLTKQVANELNLTIADFYTPLKNKPEHFIDGVHPNINGHAILAQVAKNAIVQASAPPSAPPLTPIGLQATPQLTSIKLGWSPNSESNLSGYHIYRGEGISGFQVYINTVSVPTISFTDMSVVKSKIYNYSIAAFNNEGKLSPRSKSITATTLDQIPPAAPTILTVSQLPDTVKLSWQPNNETDLDKYYLYRSTDPNSIRNANNIITSIFAPNSSFDDVSFEYGTTYYYGITAVDISGNQSEISPIINVHTFSPPSSGDTTLTAFEDSIYEFKKSDFPFSDVDNHTIDKLLFLQSNHLEYFKYNDELLKDSTIVEDFTQLNFIADKDDFGENYAKLALRVIDSSRAISADTSVITINVATVNDRPSVHPISNIELLEDSDDIQINMNGIQAGPENESSQNLAVEVFADEPSLINVGSIQYNRPETDGSIILKPQENVFGIVPVHVQIRDDGGTANNGIDFATTTFNLIVTPRNDPPTINLPERFEIVEDSNTSFELSGIGAGPFGESDQNISIKIKSNDSSILPHPQINYFSPAATANLLLETIPNVNGSTSLIFTLTDDGGTELGGKDSISISVPIDILSVNDQPNDFKILSPIIDSTLVINKYNFNDTLTINWETSTDIENDKITYNVIFSNDLAELSRFDVNSTKIEYPLRAMLSVTDTVSIANGSFSIFASDGALETEAHNNGISFKIDGRTFAPTKLNLDQNYPNPFNDKTLIGFDLPSQTNISMTIYNLLGEEIIKLIDQRTYERGYGSIVWDGRDKYNNLVSAGVYFVEISTGSNKLHKKILFLK